MRKGKNLQHSENNLMHRKKNLEQNSKLKKKSEKNDLKRQKMLSMISQNQLKKIQKIVI